MGFLYTILQTLISSELKSVIIGQMYFRLIKSRRVIASILFGLGVTLDHSFSSKWLLEELRQLGFSISWEELQYFF